MTLIPITLLIAALLLPVLPISPRTHRVAAYVCAALAILWLLGLLTGTVHGPAVRVG